MRPWQSLMACLAFWFPQLRFLNKHLFVRANWRHVFTIMIMQYSDCSYRRHAVELWKTSGCMLLLLVSSDQQVNGTITFSVRAGSAVAISSSFRSSEDDMFHSRPWIGKKSKHFRVRNCLMDASQWSKVPFTRKRPTSDLFLGLSGICLFQ